MDYQDNLMQRKAEIEQVIKQKRDELIIPLGEWSDELSLYDQNPADIASEVTQRETNLGILEMLEYELEKVNDALSRLQNGQYGVCEACGQKIEPARLERLVNTTLCANCARSQQKGFKRPAEEEVIAAGQMSDLGEGIQVAGYEFYE